MIKRFILLIPILIVVTMLVFLMRVLVPGDPVEIMFFGQQPSEETIEKFREQLGLDKPISTQYLIYLKGITQGNLGRSIKTNQPIIEEIIHRYPRTLLLAICSLLIAIILGVLSGVIAAVKQDTIIDNVSMILSLLGLSTPSFWLGLLLINTFSVKLRWFPTMGTGSWRNFVLPSLTVGLIVAAIIARLTRSTMLEVLQEDYIQTARAKGLSETIVIYKHGLRNAMIPVITIIGLQFGYLLGGAFVVEIVFAWNGIGSYIINAISQRDFPVIQGGVLIISITYTLINLCIDFIYAALDPRITYN